MKKIDDTSSDQTKEAFDEAYLSMLKSVKRTLDAIDVTAMTKEGDDGKITIEGCAGTAGTFGTAGSCFGTFGSYGSA